MTPVEVIDLQKICYDFLVENTLPLKMDYNQIAIKLAIIISDLINKEVDKTIINLGELNNAYSR